MEWIIFPPCNHFFLSFSLFRFIHVHRHILIHFHTLSFVCSFVRSLARLLVLYYIYICIHIRFDNCFAPCIVIIFVIIVDIIIFSSIRTFGSAILRLRFFFLALSLFLACTLSLLYGISAYILMHIINAIVYIFYNFWLMEVVVAVVVRWCCWCRVVQGTVYCLLYIWLLYIFSVFVLFGTHSFTHL